MNNNQDARPFVDLKKDAQEFRMKFDEDIKICLDFLDAKITALICDPDSFGTPGRNVHQNTLAEFSKAKYDIFIGVKSLINAKEQEWLDYIAEMKKLFIENVEIFLAGTKLEVKLPSSESVSSHGLRKSPGNRKSNSASITSSIYPILSTITKNIPVLGSSFQEKDASSTVSKSNIGEKPQFNRGGRLSTSSIELANFSRVEEGMDVEEPELDRSQSCSSSNIISRKFSNSGLNTSGSSSGRRSSLKKEIDLEKQVDIDVSKSVNINNVPSKKIGQHGKQAALSNKSIENISVAPSQTNINTTAPVRGRRGKLTEVTSSIENVVAQSNSSDENESQLTVTKEKEIPLREHRGRSVPKAKANDLTVLAQKSSYSTDESESQSTEIIENEVPLKSRRGRRAPKLKTSDLKVVTQNTDENEDQLIITEKEVSSKGRRGKSASKAKTSDLTVVAQNSSYSIDQNENQTREIIENEVPLKSHRGRPAPKLKINDLTGQNVVQKRVGRGRKSVKPVVEEEEIYEPGPSNSPKKVSFGADNSSSDELDIQTPVARPVKSAARRKTLLPNLEDFSDADIIPEIRSRSKVKRKTIGGVSALETVVPSKRLKVSQKAISSQEEDSSANDNLLESDGNYSDWMSLKSVDGKIPTRPAIYEVKVWRAKKSAYIGSCENLRQKLTLYNLRQNSGHKHLDKFIDRNYGEIQVRYEVFSSFNDAKQEVKNRIENFKAQHKNPPAYN